MSVEKQCDETAEASNSKVEIVKKEEIGKPSAAIQEVSLEASSSTVAAAAAEEEEEIAAAAEDGREVAEEGIDDSGGTGAAEEEAVGTTTLLRGWFEGLPSSEERAAALGFADDGPFLATFLAMVVLLQRDPPAAAASGGAGGSRGPGGAEANAAGAIDWEATVSSKDVEGAYDDFVKTFHSPLSPPGEPASPPAAMAAVPPPAAAASSAGDSGESNSGNAEGTEGGAGETAAAAAAAAAAIPEGEVIDSGKPPVNTASGSTGTTMTVGEWATNFGRSRTRGKAEDKETSAGGDGVCASDDAPSGGAQGGGRADAVDSDAFRIRPLAATAAAPASQSGGGDDDDAGAAADPATSDAAAAAAAATAGAAAASDDGDRSAPPGPSAAVRSLLGNICVVFPSSFKHASASSGNEGDDICKATCTCDLVNGTERSGASLSCYCNYPCVVLNPSYLNESSDEELFLALDAMGHHVRKAPFLSKGVDDERFASPPSNSGGSNNELAATPRCRWLKTIACDTAEAAEHLSPVEVPLYALLLARFEQAVFESYQGHRQLAGSAKNRDPGTGASVDAPTASPSELTDGSMKEGKGGADLSATHQVDSAMSDPEFRPALLGLMREVAAQAKDLYDRSNNFGSKTRAHLTEPFVEAFLNGNNPPENGSDDIGLHHVLVTPLHLLARPWKERFDFRLLDGAVDASLQRLRDHTPNSSDVQSPHDCCQPQRKAESAPTDLAVVPQENPDVDDKPSQAEPTAESPVSKQPSQVGEGGQSPSQKKKKKKSKRKKRKAQNADSPQSENQKASAPAPQDEKATEAKANGKPSSTSPPSKAKESETSPPPPPAQDADCKIGTLRSADSEETEMSTFAEVSSVKSDDSSEAKEAPASKPSTDGDITISRVEGFLAVTAPSTKVTPPSGAAATEGADAPAKKDAEADDGDAWETVGRVRGNRKKTTSGHTRSGHSTGADAHGVPSKKGKGARVPGSRKKNVARKMARDIVNSVLDSVDEEVKKRQLQQQQSPPPTPTQQHSRKPAGNPWKNGPPTVKSTASTPERTAAKPTEKASVPPVKKQPATLRDVVLGRHTKQKASIDRKSPPSPSNARRTLHSPSKGASRLKGHAATTADQNTAPTYQETVSAVSATSNVPAPLKGSPVTEDRSAKNDTSTAGTDDAPQNRVRASVAQSQGDASTPVPPLPTLLSPENANSANSSVASSLEVPHSSRRHHHNSTADVNDVGYHLLDVCDRLSRDMSLFMSKRKLALNSRRKERGALLAALQDTVASIWPGRGHVEMYGSCATQLDLPSSDLDVVIQGLDRSTEMMNAASHNYARSASMSSEAIGRTHSTDEGSVDGSQHSAPSSRHMSIGSYVPAVHGNANAERVVRLGAELENQPWAVQVNAIPTAYVPVIKVLADPSKLAGSTSGSEWLTQHQQLEAEAAPPLSSSDSTVSASGGRLDPTRHHFEPPWRGADVMNGLLKLDITFDGPEHGGIGSTQFSARVVDQACQETKLRPDATVLVQVVMVLKEILAQRKLNEPYSGGLSSYGLLLLVLALIQERGVIREEIERAELQRQAMAAGDGSSAFVPGPPQQVSPSAWTDRSAAVSGVRTPKAPESSEGAKREGPLKSPDYSIQSKASSDSTPATGHKRFSKKKPPKTYDEKKNKQAGSVSSQKQVPSSASSWASIAMKKNTGEKSSDDSVAESKKEPESKTPQTHTKTPTFADAVARSVSSVSSAPRKPAAPSSVETPSRSQKAPKGKDGNAGAKKGNANAHSVDDGIAKTSDPPQMPRLSDAPSRDTTGANTVSPSLSLDTSLAGAPSFYPQGYNDVIEVLCSGETTAGKLLMHFLLFYGQHFDSQTTAIDLSGKHERNFAGQNSPFSYYSPYIQRLAAGRIDPVTGMLMVDPIVIYDPLEGAENNNVARRCFAWNNVRWVFAQSYATLSSAVERSATPPATPGGKTKNTSTPTDDRQGTAGSGVAAYHAEAGYDLMDPSSPLLSCLLSF